MDMLSPAPNRDYPSTAANLTHPARLRAWATLYGMSGGLDGPFRFLELGCGNGANLLPLAAQFPESEFLGVDRDAALVERGRHAASVAKIGNLTLVAADLADYEPPAGPFDFVVTHGVYSWVPDHVQEKILAITERALAPQGIAYISYNTFPGWSVRGVVRDLMRSAAEGVESTGERLRASRARIAELQRHLVEPEHPFTVLLAAELGFVQGKADGYLLGEHLADRNEPVYFKDFAARAEEHGLRYLGELVAATQKGGVEFELPKDLMASGMTRVEAEQCLDILTYRQFRATVLCRREQPIADAPDFTRLAESGYFAAPLTSRSEEPLLGPGKPLRFKTGTEAEIEATRPLLKTCLLVLANAWPEGVRAPELVGAAMTMLRERGLLEVSAIDEAEIQRTMSDLVELSSRRFLEILPWRPRIQREISPKPQVSAVTRVEAETTGVVTTPRHDPAALEEPIRCVASLLDGTRDLRALTQEVSRRIDSGELSLSSPLEGPDRMARLAEVIVRAVQQIARLGLLVPPSAGGAS